MLRPLTNDEVTTIVELCHKLENDFFNKLDIVEQSNEVNLLKNMLTDLKEHCKIVSSKILDSVSLLCPASGWV